MVNMTDINYIQKSSPPKPQRALYLRKEDLRRGIELLFFAYRDFTGEADHILAEIGLGRAHHRVIYFVNRQPNMSVSELLSILQITKQSLARVLSHLISEDYISHQQGTRDKRQRLLSLTEKGRALEVRLTDLQCRRFATAYSERGREAVDGFQNVLTSLLTTQARTSLQKHRRENKE